MGVYIIRGKFLLILIELVVMYRCIEGEVRGGGGGGGVEERERGGGGHRSEGQLKWKAGLGKTRIVLFNQAVLPDSYSC